MTGESTVFTLHSRSFKQEFLAESAQDDSVELSLNEFVTILFVNLFFALADGALTTKTCCVVWSLSDI